MSLSDKDIEQLLMQLNDSDKQILVHLEKHGIADSSLTEDKKKTLPNTSDIALNTGLATNTTSQSLTRMNLKGFIVYSRLGMQKKAILTAKGMAIVNYLKKVNQIYYEELR